MIHIGDEIRFIINERKISIVDLAKSINCDRTNIYKILNKRTIDTDLLIRISQALKFDFFQMISDSMKKH